MNRKPFILLLGISLFIFGCKKKQSPENGPINNVCDISQSRLMEVRFERSYLGQPALITISTNQYTNGVLTGSVTKDSSLTINGYYTYSYPAANQMITALWLPARNYRDTTVSYLDNLGNVDSTQRKYGQGTRFGYNSLHQLAEFVQWQSPSYPPSDSVHYTWQNGDVTSVDYFEDHTGSGTMKHAGHRVCEYYTNYTGKQFFVPALPELYNLSFCPDEVLPTHFVKTIKYYSGDANSFLGQEFFEPIFDAGNKLVVLKDFVVKDGDTISTKNFSFTYQCK